MKRFYCICDHKCIDITITIVFRLAMATACLEINNVVIFTRSPTLSDPVRVPLSSGEILSKREEFVFYCFNFKECRPEICNNTSKKQGTRNSCSIGPN